MPMKVIHNITTIFFFAFTSLCVHVFWWWWWFWGVGIKLGCLFIDVSVTRLISGLWIMVPFHSQQVQYMPSVVSGIVVDDLFISSFVGQPYFQFHCIPFQFLSWVLSLVWQTVSPNLSQLRKSFESLSNISITLWDITSGIRAGFLRPKNRSWKQQLGWTRRGQPWRGHEARLIKVVMSNDNKCCGCKLS